jgi:hypothetical protein
MSKVSPVTVECSLPAILESKAIYSKHWKTLQTGQMLLGIFLPRIVENAIITVINEPPPPKERIYETRVAALKMIPAEALAMGACSKLRSLQASTNNVWGVHVAGIGSFATSAAKLLPVAAQTVIFVDRVKDMLNWIARESDAVFADWFRCILLDTPGVMLKTFQATTGVPLSILSVLDLKREDFLDDEIVRAVMELFEESYGTNDRYLFIPPIQIQLWKQNVFKEWKKSKVEGGQVEKAFAVVHMPGHWGALEVDFVRRTISFGDSLSWATPKDTIDAVRHWIECCGEDMDQWNHHVQRFSVPQQPPSSGSCAVNAINAIETSVNTRTEGWTHLTSAHHRLRLLKRVTGFCKVHIAIVFFLQ